MKIIGSVDSIIYRNNETGYSIIKILKDDSTVLTATGKFPIVGEGEEVEVQGEMKNHPKYGAQLVVSQIMVRKPTTKDQIERYLSSGLISGVGEVTAHNIVSMFGEDTLDVIENEPAKLSLVRGVSEAKAMSIALRYNEIRKLQSAVIFLQNYDVSVNMAVKIFDKYQNKTESILLKNPYKLVEDIDGIGFRTADKIAMKMGIDPESTFRMRAAVVYLLGEVAEKTGSTLCDSEDLFKDVCLLLGVSEDKKREAYEQVVANLVIDGFVKEYVEDSLTYLSLFKFYKMEKVIAGKLAKMLCSAENRDVDISFYLSEYERMAGITLHESQKEAIQRAVSSQVVVITGGPGTGKTTIVRAINNILKSMGQKTLLLAPTGRASKRLSEATGDEAKTIHRALDINFKGSQFENAFVLQTDLDCDTIIVDESSMIDTYVMYNLVNALSIGMRIVLVGDKDQLPSVGAGNILDDLIKLDMIPVVSLTQIFRQAQESEIVTNAHKINNGEQLQINNKQGDFFIMNKESQEENLDLIIELVSKRLPQYLKIEPKDVQVLAPIKAGMLGTTNLNSSLQAILNSKQPNKSEVTIGERLFRVGDRVMQTVNDYEKEWIRNIELGKGVFNGDIGHIEDINQASGETIVLFEDGRRCHYTIADLDELMLSYAITIHKSQGSEFEAVVIPITGGNPAMMTRNLLYTAVTRAKRMVVLVGNLGHISGMIKNNFSVKRKTLLKELIIEEFQKIEKLTSNV